MKRSLKAAAGAMFLIGCGDVGPPEAAKNITDAQYEIIAADLERAELQSGFVKELLDRADPLPDLDSGKKMDDNQHVKELIDSGLTDGRWYLENDHFLIADPADVDKEDLGDLAPGYRTDKDITDNYVVILHDPKDGDFESRETGTYMHEFGRFYYPIDHVLVTEKALVNYDEAIGDIFRAVYGVDDIVPEYFDTSRQNDIEISKARSLRDSIDDGSLEQDWNQEIESGWEPEYESFDEYVESEIREVYDEIAGYVAISQEDYIANRFEHPTGELLTSIDKVERFGVTREEYQEAMMQSPELFTFDYSEAEAYLAEIEQLFPEIDLENSEGSQTETRSEMRTELEPSDDISRQGRWQGKRK